MCSYSPQSKKCLEDQKKGKRAKEFPKVVWSHNTSISIAINFTPFKLLFDEKAVTPKEIKFKRARTMQEDVHIPTKAESKDLLEVDRLKVVKILHAYQVEMKVWRDKKSKRKNL
jgi:hypothetical protein